MLCDMRKVVMMMALICIVVGNLYDDSPMEKVLRASQETAPRRHKAYESFCEQAYGAYHDDRWIDVIKNVNRALNTGFYNDSLYFFRGVAYESLGYFKYAKNDYKMAGNNGVYEANTALERLKQKMKRKYYYQR